MKRFKALGYNEYGNRNFYAKAETSREVWEMMWIEANNRGYCLPFKNVIEI